jgi:hypothetical protein
VLVIYNQDDGDDGDDGDDDDDYYPILTGDSIFESCATEGRTRTASFDRWSVWERHGRSLERFVDALRLQVSSANNSIPTNHLDSFYSVVATLSALESISLSTGVNRTHAEDGPFWLITSLTELLRVPSLRCVSF